MIPKRGGRLSEMIVRNQKIRNRDPRPLNSIRV